jgi:hypothetical protein
MDCYGDSYVEECDAVTLRKIMDLIPLTYPADEPSPSQSSSSSSNLPPSIPRIPFDTAMSIVSTSRFRELEESLFMDEKPLWLFFRRYVIYLDRYLEIGNEDTKISHSKLDLTDRLVRFYGGEWETMERRGRLS